MGNGLFLSLCKSIGKSGDYIDGYADGYEEGYARAFERAEENYYSNCEPNVKLCEICKKYDGCMLWCMGRGFIVKENILTNEK